MNPPIESLGIRIFYENTNKDSVLKYTADPLFRRNDTVILQLLDISPKFRFEVLSVREKYAITPEKYDAHSALKYEKGTSKVLDVLFNEIEQEAHRISMIEDFQNAFRYLVNPEKAIFYIILLNVGFVFTIPYKDSIQLLAGDEIKEIEQGSVYIKISEKMTYDAFKLYISQDYKRIGRLLKKAKAGRLHKLDIEEEEIELLKYKFSNIRNKYQAAISNIPIYKNKDEEYIKKLAFNKVNSLKHWGLYTLFGPKFPL